MTHLAPPPPPPPGIAYPLILGTAGHIDHGKTSLVHALTGIDTDRLPVEKARGITTELGFAYLDLGERRLAVVDVPGHERFVKAMVAGASGIDLVCMVIAADEGVMPQTREHLDICHLLGIRRGLIVLTKHDLIADDDWRAMVRADVAAAVSTTFLADATVVEVSTRTGFGLDELRRQISALAEQCPPRSSAGAFRLAVDRVFTIKGFGTVVTGTILGGSVHVGDELEILPEGRTSRVRGIEVHGSAVESAHAGMRAALNLGGTALDEVARGDLLVHPGRVAASHILDVRVTHIASARHAIGRRTKVLVHHAATQVVGSLVLVDSEELAPGHSALAQLRLDSNAPLGAIPGDRFILRGFAAVADYGTTLGGGEVIRVLAPKARRSSDHAIIVTALAEARRVDRAVLLVRAAAAAGLTQTELARRLGAEPEELAASLAAATAGGELLATGVSASTHYLHAATVAELERLIVMSAHAGQDGALREDLRTHLPSALPVRAYDAIVAALAEARRIAIDGDRLKRPQGPIVTAATLTATESAILDRLRMAAVEPPRPKELPELLRMTESAVRAALDRLLALKLITKIKPDLVMETAVVATVRQRLLAHFDGQAELSPQQWKELVGASRKFTIPLAEYFDGEKLTLRVGDIRRRRK
jgi:selenocysteine-specific elongation factor